MLDVMTDFMTCGKSFLLANFVSPSPHDYERKVRATVLGDESHREIASPLRGEIQAAMWRKEWGLDGRF